MTRKRRKICFVITSIIHYSRNFLILEKLKQRDDVDLHLILGNTVTFSKYASSHFNVKEILKKRGYQNVHEISFSVEGDKHVVKAKTIGLGILEFSSLFDYLKPDLVIVRGDRFEVLAAAIVAANMNITLAHIEGGDISGTIDESIRHAITKLAHYHFATNKMAEKRIIRMGENKEKTFNFGSPDIEVVKEISNNILSVKEVNVLKLGSGSDFDPSQDFLMVMYHPITSETGDAIRNINNLLDVIHSMNLQTLWFWPNTDAGSEQISHKLRQFKDSVKNHKIRFLRYLPPNEFLSLLSETKCLIGNSSAGIKECSYLGIPVVDIGNRQNGRLKPQNVLSSGNGKEELSDTIKRQLEHGKYKIDKTYYVDNTSKKISDIVATCELVKQKKFID